jgi:hypothetical protein
MTHAELVEIGRKWLAARCPVVLTEIRAANEEPDVFGLNAYLKAVVKGQTKYVGYGSALIECKTSRADFHADQKKPFRRYPYQGIGSFRFYLTPSCLLDVDELPLGWGLLETNGKRVRCMKWPSCIENNIKAEMTVIVSAFRRLNIPEGEHTSIKAYTYETKNTATITTIKEVSGEQVSA